MKHSAVLLVGVATLAATAQGPEHYLVYDGAKSYVEVPASPDLSVTAAGLTVEAWMRPDSLSFAHTQGSLPTEQYVHWLGKGTKDEEEWTFRMYSLTSPAGPRANRVSFYIFNLRGGRGCGSYFQDPIVPGRWMDVVGVVDASARTTTIYKNGVLRHTNSFAGIISPVAGEAPLRIGSKDFASFFQWGYRAGADLGSPTHGGRGPRAVRIGDRSTTRACRTLPVHRGQWHGGA